jgi:4-amino-4-deoxy-L-arabinose transferase-like glycosyltransferase
VRGVPGTALGVGAAVLSLVLYVQTLAPTVLYYDPRGLYDSVTLQVQAYLLGVPNPTGYPTYLMLTHLFTYLPFGDVAYRVNLASGVFAAVAVFLLYAVLRRLTGRVAPAVAGALLFGVSRAFWSQAVVTEVYTLNALFICLVLLVLLVWRRERTDGWLLLAAFLMGLSLSHHMTSGLLIPAGLLFVGLVEWHALLRWRLVLKGAGLFCVGLLPYLYLPIRARMDPPLNESDPSTWENFWILVSGSRFEERMFAFGPDELPGRFELYAELLVAQFHPAFLLMAALGALYLLLKDRPALAMFGLLYAGWLVYAVEYDIKDFYLYFIPTYLVICAFVGAGLWAVLDAAGAVTRRLPRMGRTAAVAVLSALMILAPLYGVGETYRAVDRSRDYTGRETIEAVAEGTERGSTVLHNGSALWYMSLVEGRRTDLRLIDPFEPGGWTAKSREWVVASEKYLREGRVYVVFPGATETLNEGLFEKAGYDLVEDESGAFYEVVEKAG